MRKTLRLLWGISWCIWLGLSIAGQMSSKEAWFAMMLIWIFLILGFFSEE